jgi:hypothetical protein
MNFETYHYVVLKKHVIIIFSVLVYSGEYDACDVTLSVYPPEPEITAGGFPTKC